MKHNELKIRINNDYKFHDIIISFSFRDIHITNFLFYCCELNHPPTIEDEEVTSSPPRRTICGVNCSPFVVDKLFFNNSAVFTLAFVRQIKGLVRPRC